MKIFENKTVFITGGTSGIGKATALAFAKEGANVLISGRRVAPGRGARQGDYFGRWKRLV
jgi:NAD(P)-dependent dehydrogenase (short-subunit alcohol dehydrogenase family)